MGDARVETVTILFTDLVGYTQLESRVGPVAAEELRGEHFRLLRDVVGDAGGREVKNTGDGLMVAFESAAAAVSCAVLIQQRFGRRNRSAEEPLSIKVGVSAGDASTADGDVFGMPVIEAARLCDHCSGGQILAKELVAHLAAGRAHAFTPVGALELKGLPEPISAVEVHWRSAPVEGLALPQRLREMPAIGYVGRVAEREHLAELWGITCAGSLRVALIAGEAGVGKTRLSTHLALQVHGEGATVLYGRCDEDLGVPYQPWAQALGHLVKEAPQRVLDAHVERFGGDVARLVPAMRARVPDLPSMRDSDSETERYLMYAAVAGLLEAAGEQEPLLLILDDLHWADAPTLSLLRHVVSASSSMSVMVVGTYRDSELPHDHPLTALLADLHREQGVERVKLTGLGAEDLVALMEAAAGHELDDDGRMLAAEITRETAGNPFFAGEVLRHLTESGAIVQRQDGRWGLVGDLADLGMPQSVREVIGRRVERLGADARTALSAAAVIGRDFDIDLLLAAVDLPDARLLDLLDEAVSASLLQENRDRVGRFTFVHALVEYTLYEDLGHTRRARLHKRIAQALEEQCQDEPGERLAELAYHWAEAVVSADSAKAINYAQRAAERSLQQLAPDEAARWYSQALELFAQAAGGDPAVRCDLLIGLGEAQRKVGSPDHRQTLLDAASLAADLGDADRLGQAVLANSRGYTSKIGGVDPERVRALEAAAEALKADDPRRARVLALLASELHYAGDPARCRTLAVEAIEIGRSAGDPTALAFTLHNAIYAIQVPETLQERQRLAEELVELARRLDDPGLGFLEAQRPWDVGLEAGDRSQVESALTKMRALAAAVPEPTFIWQRLIYESVWATIQGDLQAAEQWAIQACEAGTSSGQPDALSIFSAQLFRVRYDQGRTGELVEQVVQFCSEPESFDVWRAFAAIALIESGRTDEACAMARAEDFQSLPWDFLWSLIFAWADVCSRLGLSERAGELYELLVPFPGRLRTAMKKAPCGDTLVVSRKTSTEEAHSYVARWTRSKPKEARCLPALRSGRASGPARRSARRRLAEKARSPHRGSPL
jgi:class 3 adenylate cyclase